jgi:Outer membrane protein beta-barrel domain
MKKLLLSFVLFSLSTFTFAQKFGVQAGVNFTNFKATPEPTGSDSPFATKAGFHVGFVTELKLVKNFNIQTGIFYNLKGTIQNQNKYNIYYIEIPLNLIYKIPIDLIGNNLFLKTGLYVAKGISAESVSKNGYSKVINFGTKNSELNSLDFGWNLGTGLNFGKFILTFNYSSGISNLVNIDGVANNTNVSVGIGYFF